uniref:Uncharacterized protein n=1 Tax=Leersia perrieri TaxID=77586 RepID=A0A0D9WIW3_9ORYZ
MASNPFVTFHVMVTPALSSSSSHRNVSEHNRAMNTSLHDYLQNSGENTTQYPTSTEK